LKIKYHQIIFVNSSSVEVNKMLIQKNKLVTTLALALAIGSIESNAGTILGDDLAKLAVFSKTYTTVEANSIVYGSMLGGDVSTTGANAVVHGDYTSVNATNVGGGTSKVYGNVVSGGVLTVGGGSATGHPNVTGSITSTGASTIGAFAQIGGDMLSGGVATTGANSVVGSGISGNVLSNGAATTGDTAKVYGDVWSADFSTIGANSNVSGNVDGLGSNVISASATVGSKISLTSTPDLSAVRTDVLEEAQQVKDAQDTLFNMGLGFVLAATMTVDTSYEAGIYSAESFSTTAGTTMTLRGDGSANQSWIFNIRDILAFGGTTKMVLENVGANASVYWNSYGTNDTGGYISSGDGSVVIGTLLANTYIMIGANATVRDIGTSCGGVYSATSYVTAGDSAKIGGLGCSQVISVPEPKSFGMLMVAFFFLWFKRSRKF
jgi:predicted acyltransferase (DUF342 family)